MYELISRDFSESLESCDFRVGRESLDSGESLFFGVAIYRFVFRTVAALGLLQNGRPCALVVHALGLLRLLLLTLLVAHTEEGCLQDVDVSLLDQVGEELQEEGHHQEADVHTVDIGIGSNDYLVITESVEPVLDIQCSLEQVELFVFIHHLLRQTEAVEGFPTKGEHRLEVDVAAFGDATAGRVTLGDEE